MSINKPRSFVTDLLLFTLSAIALPILMIFAWLTWYTADEVLENARAVNGQQAIASARAIEGVIQEPMQYLLWLSSNPQVRHLDDMRHIAQGGSGHRRLNGAMESFLNRLPQAFKVVALYDSDGKKVSLSVRDSQALPTKAHDQPWFMGAVSELALTGTAAPIHISIHPQRGHELIYALALQDANSTITGVAVLVIDIEKLAAEIVGSGRWVKNHSGQVVMGQPNDQTDLQLTAYSDIRLPGQPELLWQFVSEKKQSEVLGSVRKTQAILAATFIPALLIAGLLTIWIVFNLAKPLTQLSDWVRKAGQSDLEAGAINLSGPIEIREITQALVDLRTRIKLRQHQLHNQAEHLRIVAEFAADWELWVDAHGVCQHCSPSVEEITGIGADDFINQDGLWWSVVDERDRELLHSGLINLSDDRADVFQWRMRHVNGEIRWIEQVARRVTSREGQDLGWRATLRDITERRELEQHLRHAHRVEEIGRLAGGIAHDFNNLLSIIGGHAELLKSMGHDQPGIRHISSAVERGATLTRQLLVLSRRQLEPHTTVDLITATEQILEFIRPTIGPEIELRKVVTSQGPVWCRCSPSDIEQVMVNLINNARDALVSGGEVLLYLRTENDDFAVIEVVDNGPGLSESIIEHIFKPYYTTKAEGKGTGLGLAMAQAIIEGNKGSIQASNRRDCPGSCFTIRLPLANHHNDRLSDHDVTLPSTINISYHGLSVILVDDNKEVCHLVKTSLTKAGVLVHDFLSPQDAIDFLAQGAATDLIVSDIRMPHLNGPQMVARMRQLRGKVPVLFMTGDVGDHSDSLQGMDHWQVLMKPFTNAQLLAKMNEVLLEAHSNHNA